VYPVPRPDPDRGAATITAAAGAAVLLLLILILAAAGGSLLGSSPASACQLQPAPSTAGRGIPAPYLDDYMKAGRAYGIPWTILAGIGETESDHGRSTLPGVHSGTNPYGAAGPMQFGTGGVIGDTWGGAPVHPASQHTGGYGIDGDGDGVADVYDPGDAIPSAAAFLVAHGAHQNIPAALTAYERLPGYLTQVTGWAAKYAATGTAALAAAAAPACQQADAAPLPPGTAGKILAYAEQQLGKPYLWGATGPDAFDCSGLAMMAYQAAGITIPRTSQAQWAYGKQIPASQARPGDLVFFAGSDGTMTAPGHVGIVLRPGTMIDAPYSGQVVREEPITDTTGLVGYTQPPV
jgi:peptidoglycan DL-endopeptidase CwlO